MAEKMAGKQGPWLTNLTSRGNVIVETPNGTVHSDSLKGMVAYGDGDQQAHQGALNPSSNLGNRGGKPGRKGVM